MRAGVRRDGNARRRALLAASRPVPAGLAALCLAAAACARPAAVLPTPGPGPVQIRGEARAVFTADPDGDGVRGLFVLFAGELAEARLDGGSFLLERRFSLPGVQWVAATAGDLDGDGRDEIALTGFRPQVASVVLGERDGRLTRRGRDAPLWLRITRLPGGAGTGLACQRPSSESPFQPPVMRCSLGERGEVERGSGLDLPARVDLYDFVVVPGTAAEALYTYGEDGKWARRHGASVLWRAQERWTARPIAVERAFTSLLGESRTELQAFTPEPLVADLDGDGAAEVWQPTSDEAGFTLLSRLRVFRGGSWVRLRPEGYGLRSVASGPLVGQAMVGTAGFDVTGDGRPELVGAAVLRPRGDPRGARSSLVAWDVPTGLPVGPGAGTTAGPIPGAPPPEPVPAGTDGG